MMRMPCSWYEKMRCAHRRNSKQMNGIESRSWEIFRLSMVNSADYRGGDDGKEKQATCSTKMHLLPASRGNSSLLASIA